MIWLPLIVVLCLGAAAAHQGRDGRLQYRHRAGEARNEDF
jgi:hypothetical protein